MVNMQDNTRFEEVKKRDTISSLERGLEVLTAFDQDSREMTPAEVARRTGLPRAATRRVLLTLCKLGYAMSDGKYFRLTPKVLSLSHHYIANNDVKEWIEPILKDVVDQLKESCTLNIRDGNDTVSVLCANATSFGAVAMSVGLRIPLHVSTPGRVILASCTDEEVEEYLNNIKFEKFTPQTIVTKKPLLKEFQEIRRLQYAVGREEWEVGVFAISVPILFSGQESVNVCLTVVGNAARLKDDDDIDARVRVLQAAADQISLVLPTIESLDQLRFGNFF